MENGSVPIDGSAPSKRHPGFPRLRLTVVTTRGGFAKLWAERRWVDHAINNVIFPNFAKRFHGQFINGGLTPGTAFSYPPVIRDLEKLADWHLFRYGLLGLTTVNDMAALVECLTVWPKRFASLQLHPIVSQSYYNWYVLNAHLKKLDFITGPTRLGTKHDRRVRAMIETDKRTPQTDLRRGQVSHLVGGGKSQGAFGWLEWEVLQRTWDAMRLLRLAELPPRPTVDPGQRSFASCIDDVCNWIIRGGHKNSVETPAILPTADIASGNNIVADDERVADRALKEIEICVLLALAKSKKPRMLYKEIVAETGMGGTTVSECVDVLIGQGLADVDAGPRSGAAATTRGKDVAQTLKQRDPASQKIPNHVLTAC